MLKTALNLLDPAVEAKARKAIEAMRADEKLKALGVDGIGISETLRDLTAQMAYYSRGRMPVQDVKAMYAAAGLWEIGDEDAAKPITWTLESKHLLGKAIDLVPLRHGVTWWAAPVQVWSRMGEIGEAHGLVWGGRWKNKDGPHFEEA